MTIRYFEFSVFDSTAQDPRVTGLTPTWVFFKRRDTLADVAPQPAIVEIGHGRYGGSWDDSAIGPEVEIIGQVDSGDTNLLGADRYVDGGIKADLAGAVLSRPMAQVYSAVADPTSYTLSSMLWDIRQRGYSASVNGPGQLLSVRSTTGLVVHTLSLNDPTNPTAVSQVS